MPRVSGYWCSAALALARDLAGRSVHRERDSEPSAAPPGDGRSTPGTGRGVDRLGIFAYGPQAAIVVWGRGARFQCNSDRNRPSYSRVGNQKCGGAISLRGSAARRRGRWRCAHYRPDHSVLFFVTGGVSFCSGVHAPRGSYGESKVHRPFSFPHLLTLARTPSRSVRNLVTSVLMTSVGRSARPGTIGGSPTRSGNSSRMSRGSETARGSRG
jgi:hypothetical protein